MPSRSHCFNIAPDGQFIGELVSLYLYQRSLECHHGAKKGRSLVVYFDALPYCDIAVRKMPVGGLAGSPGERCSEMFSM